MGIRVVKLINSRKGEGYIDVVISVLVFMMLIVLALNVFSFLTLKQDMDYFAKEMIDCASVSGRTKGDVDERYEELVHETGLTPDVTWDAAYFNVNDKTVQLSESIRITITVRTDFKGFGVFNVPVTLVTKHSGLSRKYWK